MRQRRTAKPRTAACASRSTSRTALSHVDDPDRARMVDVSGKAVTARTARAQAVVRVGRAVAAAIRRTGRVAKGNVLETARLAGIQAAKLTPMLIPLCHPLVLDVVEIDVRLVGDEVRIESRVACEGKTGVEMEALTAAAVAALTVYDMCKAAEKGIEIGPIRLVEKTGGKSGTWSRKPR